MVYRKGKLSVLLGPEHLQSECQPDHRQALHDPPPKAQSARRPGEPWVFEKIGETNVYKRTRPFQVYTPRPKLERYPSGLSLSGQKVDKDDSGAKTSTETAEDTNKEKLDKDQPSTDMEQKSPKDPGKATDAHYVPSFHKSKTPRTNLGTNPVWSQNFLTDFGLRSERTDTFSGHRRHRSVTSADIERQMEEKARRHIRTCQVVGNVKRSSKAQMGYQGLRETVSPRHSPLSFYSTDGHTKHNLKHKAFYTSDLDLNKANSVPSYMLNIRKNVGTLSKAKTASRLCQENDPLPEISGRTLILGSGYDI